MASDPHPAPRAPIDAVDPLDEPAYLAFVYASWAASSALMSPSIGLAVLVAATSVLGIAAVRADDGPVPRSFMMDLGVILLFCCAAIALGILAVLGVTQTPALLVGALCLIGAATLVTWALRPDDEHRKALTPATWEPTTLAHHSSR